MTVGDVALVAAFVLGYGLVARRLARSSITGPMLFVGFGILVGPAALDLIDLDVDAELVRLLAEVTLALVLFSDATRIDLRTLRRESNLPARMLMPGMPLTIAAGTLAGLVLLGGLELWEAALLAAILAPTDAALGQGLVASREVPVRVRQAVNVESGLNDGLAAPVVTVLVALAAAQLDVGSPEGWLRFAVEQIGLGVLVGLTCGYGSGWLMGRARRAGWTERTWEQLSTLAVVGAAYGLALAVGGNGFIATFVAGIAFAAAGREAQPAVAELTEEEGQLLTLLTFLFFGVAVAGPALGELTWELALYAALSLTVVRILPIAISLVGAHLRRETVLLLGWFGPRGLASIVFALQVLSEAELPGAETIRLAVTWTVLASIVAHGLTTRALVAWYARRYADRRDDHASMPESVPMTDLPGRYARAHRVAPERLSDGSE